MFGNVPALFRNIPRITIIIHGNILRVAHFRFDVGLLCDIVIKIPECFVNPAMCNIQRLGNNFTFVSPAYDVPVLEIIKRAARKPLSMRMRYSNMLLVRLFGWLRRVNLCAFMFIKDVLQTFA